MYPQEKQLNLTGATSIHVAQPTEPPTLFIPKYLPLVEIKNMVDEETFDDSISGIIPFTTWREFAHTCHGIRDLDTEKSVVIFNSVRAILFDDNPTHTTTFGTRINLDAEGQGPATLKKWFEENEQELANRKTTFVERQPIKKEIQRWTLHEAITSKHLKLKLELSYECKHVFNHSTKLVHTPHSHA